jgi:hypothetical protein
MPETGGDPHACGAGRGGPPRRYDQPARTVRRVSGGSDERRRNRLMGTNLRDPLGLATALAGGDPEAPRGGAVVGRKDLPAKQEISRWRATARPGRPRVDAAAHSLDERSTHRKESIWRCQTDSPPQSAAVTRARHTRRRSVVGRFEPRDGSRAAHRCAERTRDPAPSEPERPPPVRKRATSCETGRPTRTGRDGAGWTYGRLAKEHPSSSRIRVPAFSESAVGRRAAGPPRAYRACRPDLKLTHDPLVKQDFAEG